MGTLTAGVPRLDTYCEHKLPTSCRLSSIGECCACYDERAHAATYVTYVDGIGLVPRGTRWQRYCWFCKEFWEARVAASGMRPGQTRIPEVPDQSPFLERWYEFHRGYRVVVKEDGTEERIAVLGEDLRDVEPGHLPRTLDELREGRERSALEAAEREAQSQLQPGTAHEEEPAGPTLEDTLDQLFLDASAGDSAFAVQNSRQVGPVRTPPQVGPAQSIHTQALAAAGSRNREYQTRRIAALRRELHRMRNGIERVISGLREFGENVPDAGEATGQLTTLGRTLDDISGGPPGDEADLAIRSATELTNTVATSQSDQTLADMQARVDEAREHVNEARRMRDQAASEFDVAEQEFNTSNRRLQQLQRDQRTAENYTRIFGTREEIQAQGDDYESPVGGMFSRAYERFNVAEQVRQEERTLRQVLDEERRNGGEDGMRRMEEFENRPHDVWSVRRPPQLLQESTSNTTHLMEEARDEVFAGQTLAYMTQEAQQVAELAGDEPPGHNNNNDTTLEEYYSLLRRQGWSQQAPRGGQGDRPSAENVPESYPEGFVAALQRADQTREQLLQISSERSAVGSFPPVEPYSATAVDRREDLTHILHFIRTHDDWREEIGLEVNQVYMGLVICASSLNNQEIVDDLIPRISAVMGGIDPTSLLQRTDLVWRCGLPAARLVRIRRAGQQVSFSNQPQTTDIEVMRGNMEVMAEAFQMSAELRRRSGLTAQEQLNMMHRLHLGERSNEDRTILASMLLELDTVQLASNIHRQGLSPRQTEQQTQLDEQRREAARDGDFSRQGLNAQRREASAFAMAAGRLAMQRGLVTQDSGAYGRLFDGRGANPTARTQQRVHDHSWSSEEEEEEDQEQGLDAKDSGRPEPKTDEEMEVKLECRICYSQVADVACLPCGHLVMCKWCSEQHSPTMQHDRTRPRRAAGCPVCRKGIRQKVRVFRA
jgi:hypothetical protein